MRRAVHICLIVLLGYLIADRAIVRSEAGEPGTITCEQGADRVRLDALQQGFSAAGAHSQSEAFLASCVVTGHGTVDELTARE
jgi:hypothetical protein